ncbi:MAG: alpha/beta fold hydrolase [Actinophytocola sp.]|uniref:alpha/beta fold hydrolase n=1 Tax=Actinophytocola sp. TaxID=1872138 RepID=UPI00132ADD63|nr:alpha/beta fold hydrolase [Actinophytocola sp.]MPZ81281.1 alpha/beta fold hydrolase [Actinophytocola sp.]
MKLLALLHSPVATGSDTTIRRIAAHLRDSDHSVLLVPEPEEPGELARVAERHRIDALLGTHALFSGRPFLEIGLPYVLILGGTDLNEYALEPEYRSLMTEAVERAACLVAFNEDFVRRSGALWPQVVDKVHYIPQSVHTTPSTFSLRRSLRLERDARLLLLPSGLRPVKDPLFLVDCVKQWHEVDPRIRLVISGRSYDPDYEDILLRRIGSSPAVRYVGALTRDDLHAAMREADAVLNTSLSECSPNSVLEAMDLGRPVIVRDIPGNTCLVEHEVTGLVFDRPDDFRAQGMRLLDDELLAQRVRRQGRQFVRRSHGLEAERAAYAGLFRDLLEELPSEVDVESRDRLIRVGGVHLCVQTFGGPEDPAVLLIAGTSASMLSWETEFCERLAAGSRFVIRYDHRDTGRSVNYRPGEPPYELRDLAADAIGILDGLGITRAHLVGISMGGMIAQLAALGHEERVASIALLSTSPGGPGPDNPDLPSASLRVRVELDDIPLPDWDDRGEVIDYLVASDRVLASRSRDFDEVARRRLAGRIVDRAPEVLPSTANHLTMEWGQPWRQRLADVRVPTLVIHGGQDPIYPIAHAHALVSAIPDATLQVLEQAGHELARADWETVTTALLRHTAGTERWSDRATTPL